MSKKDCPFSQVETNPCYVCGLSVSRMLRKRCPYWRIRTAALKVVESATAENVQLLKEALGKDNVNP